MLHVTIKDNITNEVIFDREVSAVAMQAVDQTNSIRMRRVAEDAEPWDAILCSRAILKAASEIKKHFSDFLEVLDESTFDEGDDE